MLVPASATTQHLRLRGHTPIMGGRASHLVLQDGTLENGDKVLCIGNPEAIGRGFGLVNGTFKYPPMDVRRNEVISYIAVCDNWGNGMAKANVLRGGVGSTSVEIKLESPGMFRGYQFTIVVTGRLPQ